MRSIPREGPLSFGFRRSDTHTHRGVDIVAPEGTPLHAPWPGTVLFASSELGRGFSGYGGHVVIDTPIGYWLFGHLAAVHVQPGQRVGKGQHFGDVGRTCYSTEDPGALCSGAHAHVELSGVPYPQDSEAPRLDPVDALESAGGLDLLFHGVKPLHVPPPKTERTAAAPLGWLLLGTAAGGALLLAWKR